MQDERRKKQKKKMNRGGAEGAEKKQNKKQMRVWSTGYAGGGCFPYLCPITKPAS